MYILCLHLTELYKLNKVHHLWWVDFKIVHVITNLVSKLVNFPKNPITYCI